MFLLIDNYDSFTYNLVQAFYALGHKPEVRRNDDPALLDLATSPDLTMVCISPGPGRPEDTGLCPEFLNRLSPRIPVLGVWPPAAGPARRRAGRSGPLHHAWQTV